jgi:hypothetical protein
MILNLTAARRSISVLLRGFFNVYSKTPLTFGTHFMPPSGMEGYSIFVSYLLNTRRCLLTITRNILPHFSQSLLCAPVSSLSFTAADFPQNGHLTVISSASCLRYGVSKGRGRHAGAHGVFSLCQS